MVTFIWTVNIVTFTWYSVHSTWHIVYDIAMAKATSIVMSTVI